MALSNGSVLLKEFVDHNSFIYSLSILSIDNSMNVVPIYVNGYGPYNPPVELTETPSIGVEKFDFYITNDIGDSTILYLDNPFYHPEGVPIKPQVTTTWNGSIVSYTVTNPNSHPVHVYTNDKSISMLGPGETSSSLKMAYNSSDASFTLKISFRACGVYSTPFSETIVNSDIKIENNVSKVLYYKNITPEFLDSDRSGGSGFSNTTRLKELLNNWGFSEVDVSQVTEWKISALSQYTSDGPRLEWKGKLFVKDSKLHLLKCRNKDNTKRQTCYDLRLGEFILLNTNASGYSGSDWKYIHITELGFAMRATYAFLKENVEYFDVANFMQSESKEIYHDDNRIYPTSITIAGMNNWPWKNYYIPGYGVKGKSLNATGYLFEQSKTVEDTFKYFTPINFNDDTKNFFTGNPLLFNFTKTPLVKYEWIYEDFTYSPSSAQTTRRGHNSLLVKYSNNKLIVEGYSGSTTTGQLKEIDFDIENDMCFLFFRDSTSDVDVGTIRYSQILDPESIVNISVDVTMSIPEDGDTFTINLKPIEYRALNFKNNTQYVFNNYDYYTTSYWDTKHFSKLAEVVIGNNSDTQKRWKDFLDSFIIKNITNYSIKEERTFKNKEDLGVYKSYWKGPSNFGYTVKTSNLQTLKDIEKTSFTNSLSCSFEQPLFDENAFSAFLHSQNFLKTGLRYIYKNNVRYNGFLNSGRYNANFSGWQTSEGGLSEYWYSFKAFEDGSEYGATTDGMPTVITIYAQHTGGYSIGLDIDHTSPTALALLVLSTNKNTTVIPDSSDDNTSSGGSGGGNIEDPVTPNPNPGITPIQ